MPLFISNEEFERCSHDVSLVAEKADSFIRDLQRQLETVRAQADAASITAEQTCSLLEQKFLSLSSDFEKLESQNAQLSASIEQRVSELAEVQSEKHKIHLELIGKDGEIERLSTELSELHKSKRQILDLVEQKDSEINEKNATIKSYLDKIVSITDAAAVKQAQLHDKEAELARSNATCARLSQEKELIERHNKWLNEELTAKVQDLIEARKTHNEVEADISSKLGDVEKQFSECSSSLKWYKTRVTELEAKITSLQDELCSSREAAATDEERFSAEVATVTKLVGLYKESSEEWSKKAGELEGVIKALETHLNQIESDYKETLQKEVDARKLHEKEAADLKEKVEKCEAELEKYRKANELCLLPISSFVEETWAYRSDADDIHQNDHMPVPKIPAGVSGTALAASLLRDGWSLAKMYEKYQEAVDALRHESMGRKQSQAILERVLYEIEEKAEIILDERAEHEKMADAYSVINQKLQESVSEQAKLEGRIQELKAELFRSQREYDVSQKEITDLQKQVTVLLKECRDIQVRCGSASNVHADACAASSDVDMDSMSDIERVISERLLTFKDINELVEQNVKLRSLVRSLSDQNEKRDTEMREMFEMELQKQTDKAASKVAVVLDRAEEQGKMIESLHSSVAMYKRLYEEELKHRSSYPTYSEAVTDPGRRDHMLLLENSEDASKKAKEQAVEHVKRLEEELEKFRNEAISLRLERDKLSMESNFARERLDRFMKEFDHQRDEMNGVLSRNIEFSQLVVDYQRKIRESSDTLHAAEELSRKLDVEVTLLKHEKQLLVNSEKRACDEIRSLSERVHRLQASLDTIHSVEEVREEARVMEIRKKEDYLKQVERDWAEVKKELQEERDNVRTLTRDREHTIKDAMRQVEELGKRLAETLRAVSLAESRAAVAEARYSDIEAKYMHFQDKAVDGGQDPSTSLTSEETMGLHKVREELEKLKAEAQANKDHMLQYKNIAQVNEAALKQIESAHERFKVEADKTKKSLEAEILSLRERLSEHESDSSLKSREAASAVAEKEEALRSALVEIDNLKEENCMKMSQITGMEVQISSLKENVEEEHRRWRTAQNNYERQVILQSETIQELTKTSQALGLLQEEVSHLRKLSDTQKNEIHILKDQLASEKSVLSRLKDEAEEKYNEVNGQNKILHARLEALHIKLAEKERHTSGSTGHDPQGDGDLQTVVSYLRRSKEIAETEISLLKQEKHRLQSQLESALKASETVQTQLQAERANSRSLLFSDEDFKSLQIQVREMNLLRESNLQLREENKHNFEECQKLRELAQNTRVEMEHLKTMLREKEIEVESCRKEIEMQKIEKGSLESRIVDLLAMCKNVDLEDYNRIKDEYQQMQVKLRAVEAELDETRKLVSEKQYSITRMEQELANTRAEFAERETRINEFLQSEATLKLNADRLRRVASQLKKKSDSLTTEKEEWSNEKQTLLKQLEDSRQVKRPLGDTSGEHLFKKKLETLTKEKEELINEKQTLLKQLEDSRQVKRPLGDTSSEQTMKEKEQEKDTRIQMLEKTLERERDKFKKEKSIRATLTKTVLDKFNTVKQEQDKLVSELEKYRQNRESLLEGGLVAQTPENVVDNQAASYLAAVQNLDDMITNTDEFAGVPHSDTSTMDLSSVTAGRQVPTQTSLPIQPSTGTAVGSSQTKIAEEREKKSRSLKLKRPLIAPPRPQTPSGDTEMSEGNVEVKPQVQPSAPRKRIAPMAASESQTLQDGNSTVVPPQSKKSKSDVPEEGHAAPAAAAASVPSPPPPLPQSLEAPASTLDEASDAAGNQSHEVAEKDEVRAPSDIVVDEAPKEETLLDVHETQNDESIDAAEDLNDNTAEIEDDLGEGMKDEEEQEPPSEMESDREEGELPPEVVEEEQDGDDDGEGEGDDDGDGDGGDIEAAEDLASSVPEVAGEEEEPQVEVMETISSTVVNVDEKNDLVEGVEEMGEDSDKATDLVDDAETEKSPDTAIDGVGGSSSPSNASDPPTVSDVSKEDESPAERSATTTASTRLSGRLLLRSRTSAGSPSTTTARGGGAPSRGNRPRGGRFGRRSTSDESRG